MPSGKEVHTMIKLRTLKERKVYPLTKEQYLGANPLEAGSRVYTRDGKYQDVIESVDSIELLLSMTL